MSEVCSSCRYFDPDKLDGLGGILGLCRIQPPVADMMPVLLENEEHSQIETGEGIEVMTLNTIEQIDVTRHGIWPSVNADDWCGEHRER